MFCHYFSSKREKFHDNPAGTQCWINIESILTLLHSERPKLHRVLSVLSAVGLIQHQDVESVLIQYWFNFVCLMGRYWLSCKMRLKRNLLWKGKSKGSKFFSCKGWPPWRRGAKIKKPECLPLKMYLFTLNLVETEA